MTEPNNERQHMTDHTKQTINRGYFTWEEDFLGERCELHGFAGELVAIIDKESSGNLFYVENASGNRIFTGMQKAHAQLAAQSFLDGDLRG